jgi:hypothetical protein
VIHIWSSSEEECRRHVTRLMPSGLFGPLMVADGVHRRRRCSSILYCFRASCRSALRCIRPRRLRTCAGRAALPRPSVPRRTAWMSSAVGGSGGSEMLLILVIKTRFCAADLVVSAPVSRSERLPDPWPEARAAHGCLVAIRCPTREDRAAPRTSSNRRAPSVECFRTRGVG